MEKTIYKKDTKGNVRFLTVKAEGSFLIQESGRLNTEDPVIHKKECKAKSVGKSNETTPEEQAVLEAERKWKNKLSEGYFETEEECKNTVVILPMLAKSYEKECEKINWKNPVFAQPKLDGMRGLHVGNAILHSRKGKVIDTLSHIVEDLKGIGLKLDGELYAHGLSFQENMKIIKKYRKGRSENVKFHVYDVVSELPFEERYALLEKYGENYENIVVVPTYKIESEQELIELHQKFLKEGYEGTMVRHGGAPYKVKGRSSNLLKYKDFIDEAYKVIDVEPSDVNPEQGFVKCQLNVKKYYITNSKGDVTKVQDTPFEGAIYGYPPFGCGMKFSHKEREDILTNKDEYIGEMGEIRFFEFTDGGMPRFPVCVGFRLDK